MTGHIAGMGGHAGLEYAKDLKRPKFERQVERFSRDVPAFAMGYVLADNNSVSDQEIFYGADISTLTRMIEAGEI